MTAPTEELDTVSLSEVDQHGVPFRRWRPAGRCSACGASTRRPLLANDPQPVVCLGCGLVAPLGQGPAGAKLRPSALALFRRLRGFPRSLWWESVPFFVGLANSIHEELP